MNRKEQTRLYRKAIVPAALVNAELKSNKGSSTEKAAGGIAPRLCLALLERNAARVSEGSLSRSMYARQKTALLRQLQQHYGNGAAQRLVKDIEGKRPRGVQTRMVVGAAGDRYEREADRVARAVVAFLTAARGKPVQRLRVEDKTIRPKPATQGGVSAEGGRVDRGVEHTIRNARGGGRSLPGPLRADMERAFRADFKRVRIHTGATPDALNRYLGSAAFTSGSDIFFRKSFFRPGARYGLEILAHELTHVIQQGRA